MAYAAVNSLEHTIEHLLHSPRISIVSSTRYIVDARDDVRYLREALQAWVGSRNRKLTERMKGLDEQIGEAVCKLEDVLESHVLDQLLSQSERNPSMFSLDLQALEEDFICFGRTARKIKERIKEHDNRLHGFGDDDAFSLSSTDLGGNNSAEMVGLDDMFHRIRTELIAGLGITTRLVVGMPGTGKTTLVKKIFEDPLVLENFECRAFVRVGQKYQIERIFQDIIAQANPGKDKTLIGEGDDLAECLLGNLNGRRILIVLDDVWDPRLLVDFVLTLSADYSGSQILVTSRLEEVVNSIEATIYKIPFLNKEESWDLLCRNLFAEKSCPSQLEKAGRKIAENCEGLPLLIVTVAELLSKAEKTLEYWNKVVGDKENFIFMEAYDQISKVAYPSYNNLPQQVKSRFLYMGVFPQNCDIHFSKLINLWIAERVIEQRPRQDLQSYGVKCLSELVSSNVVVVRQRSNYSHKVKACCLHSVFWHLIKREAGNNKFLHIINSCADGLAEGKESQRRLSIYKNILFSIKDIYNSMASISIAHSLLCTGAHHQYQVPVCFNLRLLKVIDALTIRFYEFPMEILKLFQLRYLALTYYGNLPSSISKLWNLEYLIVHQYLSIKFTVAQSYLPVEIWDLNELKYLKIPGRNLPDPHGKVLPNLFTLLDVGVHSCTTSVLNRIPKLRKLKSSN